MIDSESESLIRVATSTLDVIVSPAAALERRSRSDEIAGGASADSSETAMEASAGNQSSEQASTIATGITGTAVTTSASPQSSSQKPCPGFPMEPHLALIENRQWHAERAEFSPLHIRDERCWSKGCQVMIKRCRHLCWFCQTAKLRLESSRQLLKKGLDEVRSTPNRWLTLKEKLQKAELIKIQETERLLMSDIERGKRFKLRGP